MEAYRCNIYCTSPHSSQQCLRCAQDRLRSAALPQMPTHSIHIPGSPYAKGKYVLHDERAAKQAEADEKMIISSLTQIIYGVLMFACLVLTVVALFTPGWRKFNDEMKQSLSTLQIPAQQGILPYACSSSDSTTTTSVPGAPQISSSNYCDTWWTNLQKWEKAVIVLMVLAVIAEILALAWNAFTCCACCCKKYLIAPLTSLSLLVAALLCAVVIVYGINNKDFFGQLRQAAGQNWSTISLENLEINSSASTVGYSFWLTVGALVLAVVNVVISVVTVFFGERCC